MDTPVKRRPSFGNREKDKAKVREQVKALAIGETVTLSGTAAEVVSQEIQREQFRSGGKDAFTIGHNGGDGVLITRNW